MTRTTWNKAIFWHHTSTAAENTAVLWHHTSMPALFKAVLYMTWMWQYYWVAL